MEDLQGHLSLGHRAFGHAHVGGPSLFHQPPCQSFSPWASDDQLGFAPASTEVYNAWLAQHRSAELHIYAKGGHGFGMRQQGLPVDSWSARFEDWLRFQGLLQPRSK